MGGGGIIKLNFGGKIWVVCGGFQPNAGEKNNSPGKRSGEKARSMNRGKKAKTRRGEFLFGVFETANLPNQNGEQKGPRTTLEQRRKQREKVLGNKKDTSDLIRRDVSGGGGVTLSPQEEEEQGERGPFPPMWKK